MSLLRYQASESLTSISPGLFTDGDTFFTPSVKQTIFPGLFTDGDTFYGPFVGVGVVFVQPALFTDGDTFYAPLVKFGPLLPGLFTDGDSFYAPAVAHAATRTTQFFIIL